MTQETKTPEQLAAEAAAAVQVKAQAAADKVAAVTKAKAEKAAASAAEKAKKEAEKAAAKAAKEAETKAKADAKAATAATKEATKMPEQNGIRRPKADGACGKVWAFADGLSAQLGQPVPIANLSAAASSVGINDSTIRTQYALWRKFHGITGRVALPVVVPAPVDAEPATA